MRTEKDGNAAASRQGSAAQIGEESITLPNFVNIKEVGPREGMQFEKGAIATADKIRLVDMLSECNFKQIEVTSFVSPKWVPQMADADEVARSFTRRPGTEYSCIFLNAK